MDVEKLITSIQDDVMNESVSLATILVKAKLLAHFLKHDQFAQWVKNEVEGYSKGENLPDYRVWEALPVGLLINKYGGKVTNQRVPIMYIKEDWKPLFLTYQVGGGVREIEALAKNDNTITLSLPADWVMLFNSWNEEVQGGWYFLHMHWLYQPQNYATLLDVIKHRLIDFILAISDKWALREEKLLSKAEVDRIFNIYILNNNQNEAQGGNVTTFNQDGQTVSGNQYNAGNDINIQSIENQPELIAALEQVRAQLQKAEQEGGEDIEVIIDADTEVRKALTEAKKDDSNKGKIQGYLEKAVKILEPIGKTAGATTAILKLIELFG